MSTPEIGLYQDATPDEQIAYSMGWNTATAIARTEAFAAIRRAAAVARDLDDRSAETFAYGNKVQAIADGMSSHNIRRAIRAAIGSEKQS